MAGQFALADSTTDIVDALVSKGVLTEEEGKLITKGHESKKKSEGTTAFKDGFKFNSGDGKNNISVNGRIQADYRAFDTPGSATPGSASSADTADTFDLRRTYLTAKGTFRNTNFEATVNGGSSGVAVKYYWLEYVFSDKLNVRFGQFKTPMGMEVQTSSRFTDTTERDFNSYLTSSINKGIMIHGVPMAGTTYQFMVSNGGLKYEEGEGTASANRETSNTSDGKSYTGRLTANFAEIMGNKEAIMHVGASYGVDNNLTTSAFGDIAVRTNARGTTFFKSPVLTNPEVSRYGLEGIAAFGPYKLAAEYNNASYESAGSADRDIDAYYVNASWMITGETYAPVYKNGLMGGRMIPKNDFAAGNGWGAWEVLARYSNFDATDFTIASVADSGSNLGKTGTNKAHSWTAGVKWITDPNTRFLLNYVDTSFGSDMNGYNTTGSTPNYKNEKAINFRAQFDF
jgi:phosphate-selective porin OprO/OprP